MLYNFLDTDAWDFAFASREDLAKIARTMTVYADTQQERLDQVCYELCFDEPLNRRRALDKFMRITCLQEEKDHLEAIYQAIIADPDLQEYFAENVEERV